jgi:hypothetical protein
MAECRHHAGYDCGDLPMPHSAVPENKLAKPKRRNRPDYRLAVLLSAILEEPGDNPDNPAQIRIDQAGDMLTQWSSAKSSLIGAAWEILNVKQGHCVRCRDLIQVGTDQVCQACGRVHPSESPTIAS